MNKLSVVIITLNEEDNIAKCIASVKEVADEILVVDSFSTDETVRLAIAHGARVIQNKFQGHIQQKNFAKDQAQFDYVLSIDGDETLSEELKQSILDAKKNLDADGYKMNRLNFYCGKPIKTCGWYPDTKLRLWNRTKGTWGGTNPHDIFELHTDAKIIHLKGDIHHNTYPTREALISQTAKFGRIGAEHLKGRSNFYLFPKLVFSAPFRFIRNYIFKLGFTEGNAGFTICYQQSREVYLKYRGAIRLKYQ